MSKKKINVAIIGFGTVGTGTARILLENKDIIQQRLGADLFLKYIVDLDIDSDRGLDLNGVRLISTPEAVFDDPDVDIVVELIGGYCPAKEFVLKAIERNKHVVTANKALLACHGKEIFAKSQANNVYVGFEATVAGGIPVVSAIKEGFAGNRIVSIFSIINGTANFILSKMTDEGGDFYDVLKVAQEEGYAEADPAFDIEGIDSAHKIAILASIAFGTSINPDDIYTEGICDINQTDIKFSEEFGYRIKLLAIAKKDTHEVDVRVHPVMVKKDNPIANVNGVLNAVEIVCDFAGKNMLVGYGAGANPTGSAVVGDIVDISRNIISESENRVYPLSWLSENLKDYKVKDIENIVSKYYLRFMVIDEPGVLSEISGILGSNSIGIASVIQKNRSSKGGEVPLIIMTHSACERDVKKAILLIDELDVVLKKSSLIRVESSS